jgi:hypothetical protein
LSIDAWKVPSVFQYASTSSSIRGKSGLAVSFASAAPADALG